MSSNILGDFNAQAAQVSSQNAAAALKSDLGGESAAKAMVGSIDELKRKYPKFYKQLTEQIAQGICDMLQKHAQKMKEIMRKNQT